MTEPTITIDFDGSVTLSVKDVWPDGDAPEHITADAVKAVMEFCGGKARVIRDWDLDDYITVTVTVLNPQWCKDEPSLPGVSPPDRFLTAEVWP